MRKKPAILLLALAFLITGCPHNHYLVELSPRGTTIERKLAFYCADGTDTNGEPRYQSFPTVELAAINALYPALSVSNRNDIHMVAGEFTGRLPDDVGGAGFFSNYTNSLGSASFYHERFRGSDDQAAQLAAHFRAADKLTDHLIAWSRMELGNEPHYQELRQFLDKDFREDLKNFSLIMWNYGDDLAALQSDAAASERLFARVGQFLVEHGYLQQSDLPAVALAFQANASDLIGRIASRVVAQKLKITYGTKPPKSLAFLHDPDSVNASWEKYLASTPEYQDLLWKWRKKKATATYLNPTYVWNKATGKSGRNATNAVPPKPAVREIIDPIFADLAQVGLGADGDSLEVRLSLSNRPLHTNGKWNDATHEVTWESGIDSGTNQVHSPVLVFASWVGPNESFQKDHFGKVLLDGDPLVEYSLWVASLSRRQTREWSAFIDSLQQSDDLYSRIASFAFSPAAATSAITTNINALSPPSDFRERFKPKEH